MNKMIFKDILKLILWEVTKNIQLQNPPTQKLILRPFIISV